MSKYYPFLVLSFDDYRAGQRAKLEELIKDGNINADDIMRGFPRLSFDNFDAWVKANYDMELLYEPANTFVVFKDVGENALAWIVSNDQLISTTINVTLT